MLENQSFRVLCFLPLFFLHYETLGYAIEIQNRGFCFFQTWKTYIKRMLVSSWTYTDRQEQQIVIVPYSTVLVQIQAVTRITMPQGANKLVQSLASNDNNNNLHNVVNRLTLWRAWRRLNMIEHIGREVIEKAVGGNGVVNFFISTSSTTSYQFKQLRSNGKLGYISESRSV